MKDRYEEHLHRSDMNAENYRDVVDSASFCEFGKATLSKPGPRSGIERRTFYNLPNEIIKLRKQEVRFFY